MVRSLFLFGTVRCYALVLLTLLYFSFLLAPVVSVMGQSPLDDLIASRDNDERHDASIHMLELIRLFLEEPQFLVRVESSFVEENGFHHESNPHRVVQILRVYLNRYLVPGRAYPDLAKSIAVLARFLLWKQPDCLALVAVTAPPLQMVTYDTFSFAVRVKDQCSIQNICVGLASLATALPADTVTVEAMQFKEDADNEDNVVEEEEEEEEEDEETEAYQNGERVLGGNSRSSQFTSLSIFLLCCICAVLMGIVALSFTALLPCRTQDSGMSDLRTSLDAQEGTYRSLN